MKKIFLLFFVLISLILSGCSTNKNKYGIKEKETDEYISVYTNEDDLWYWQGVYLKLNFISESISYDVYAKNGDFGYEFNHCIITYNKEDSIELCWMGSNNYYHKTFYIDVIIMENNSIIGYTVIKIIYNEETRHEVSMIKQVIFPDAIKRKIEITKDLVKVLIEDNKQYVNDINEIIEENTDEFVTLLGEERRISSIFYNYSIEGVEIRDLMQLNFINEDYLYNIRTDKGLLEHRFTNVREKSYNSYSSRTNKITIYWDISYEDEINDIKNIPLTYVDIIVYEGKSIIGYVVIKIEKIQTGSSLSNVYSCKIIKQVKFPNKYNNYQNITKEQVNQLIKKSKEVK